MRSSDPSPSSRFARFSRLSRIAAASSAVLGIAAVTGCAGGVTTTPRSRVAADMGCTTQETGVSKIEAIPGEKAARWRVTGCGRTAIYVCTTPVRDCWREGAVAPESEAPTPR